MTDTRPTLYIIDGNSYIYRAFHAIRNLSTSKGLPTNAVYGFTNMLLKVVGDKNPDYLVVCFDPKGPTTRHGMYDKYKATRPAMPDELRPQVPYIHRIVGAFNIPVLLFDGIEADDVIASVALDAAEKGFDVTVVTGDKDLFQLIGGNVKVYDTMKDVMYGPAECEERFGVPPGKLVDLLGLMGDSSDNIPGVPGVGPKTAAKLISEYGSVESLLEQVDTVKTPKLRENLKAHADDARLSKELVTLMRGLPEHVDIEGLKRRPQDPEALIALFKELEFGALMKHVTATSGPGLEHSVVTTAEGLESVVEELKDAGAFALGVMASGPFPMSSGIVGISLCPSEEKSYYVPLGHIVPSGGLFPELLEGQIPASGAIRILRPVMEDPGVRKFGHDIKRDVILLANAGVGLAGVSFDTMVGSYLLNPGRASHSLENVTLDHLGRKPVSYADVAGSGARQAPFAEVGIDAAAGYAAGAAHAVRQLAGLLGGKLKEEGLSGLFDEVELPLISVLAEIEMNGVYVDRDYLAEMSKEIGLTLDGIVGRIYALAGAEFNINSPKQLAEILFEKLGLPPLKKTKTGYSTDEEVLTSLAVTHELPAEVLNYRELFKLKSTYVDTLGRLINTRTGRVHTSLNQAVAATGRLSSSGPNLQNIPIRTEMGRRIRQAFSAPPGRVIISADYSQIELRLMAHLSKDPSLTDSFMHGEDVHARTASEIFGVSPEAVSSEMRRNAKAINFGIMYGMGSYGLAVQIGVHPAEAKRYIDAYFE
ncbi:MAG TPA: DNA polymerase I, partial [Nitrospirota bacterium]